jgi:hypothetical protein
VKKSPPIKSPALPIVVAGWRCGPPVTPSNPAPVSGASDVPGQPGIETSAQAAEALKPVASPLAFTIAGIVGTGLLSVPVLDRIGSLCLWAKPTAGGPALTGNR